jgi:adenylosuccinate lyase
MRRNLEASGDHIYSEVIMLALAAKVGRRTAHRLVHRVTGEAAHQGRVLRQAIRDDIGISAHLPATEIDRLFDAALQTGQCGALVDRVLKGQE